MNTDWRNIMLPSKMIVALREDRRRGELTDVLFAVGEGNAGIFRAHKVVLATGSPVFENMLYDSSYSTTFRIPDLSSRAFWNVLDFLYGEEISYADPLMALETYKAARKFQVAGLEKESFAYIKYFPDTEIVLNTLKIAMELEMLDLRQNCLVIIERQAEFLLNNIGSASVDVFEQVLKSCHMRVLDKEIFEVIACWQKGKPDDVKRLLSYVNFRNMKADDFDAVIKKYPSVLSTTDASTIRKYVQYSVLENVPKWYKRYSTLQKC